MDRLKLWGGWFPWGQLQKSEGVPHSYFYLDDEAKYTFASIMGLVSGKPALIGAVGSNPSMRMTDTLDCVRFDITTIALTVSGGATPSANYIVPNNGIAIQTFSAVTQASASTNCFISMDGITFMTLPQNIGLSITQTTQLLATCKAYKFTNTSAVNASSIQLACAYRS